MSGHSKWANIKHKKEKTDSQKGKVFTKIGREISVVVKQGGADPEANSKLKDVIAKAKALNIPNDNIMRSIKKAAGELDAQNYEEILYEGYGPGGVAVIVETLTDNRNRTAGDIRHYFDKFGGNLGTSGCVLFLFNKKGVIIVENDGKNIEDMLMTIALDNGADDFAVYEEYYEIVTDPEILSIIRDKLEKENITYISAEIEMIPATRVELSDQKHTELMEKLIDHLEDLEDVQEVYHNWDN